MTWPPLVTAPKDGPTVGRGDRRTTPLRRIHAVQPRRLRVPSPLCGVSPVGLPAPQPSLRNIILAAILGPQTADSRTATGHTSGARLSTPHASATLELLVGAGCRPYSARSPCFKACAPWWGQPKPLRAPRYPCAQPVFPPATSYGYQRPSGWADREERKEEGLAGPSRLVRVASRGLAWACRSCHLPCSPPSRSNSGAVKSK